MAAGQLWPAGRQAVSHRPSQPAGRQASQGWVGGRLVKKPCRPAGQLAGHVVGWLAGRRIGSTIGSKNWIMGSERSNFPKWTIQNPIQISDPKCWVIPPQRNDQKKIGSRNRIKNRIMVFGVCMGPGFRSKFSIHIFDPNVRSKILIHIFDPNFRSKFSASQPASLPHSQPAGQQAGRAALPSYPTSQRPSQLASQPPSLLLHLSVNFPPWMIQSRTHILIYCLMAFLENDAQEHASLECMINSGSPRMGPLSIHMF